MELNKEVSSNHQSKKKSPKKTDLKRKFDSHVDQNDDVLLEECRKFLSDQQIKKLPKCCKNNRTESGPRLFTEKLIGKLIQVNSSSFLNFFK